MLAALLGGDLGRERADVERLQLLAHDVNNPLTAIRIIAEMLKDEAVDDQQRDDMVDILESADLVGLLLEGMTQLAQGADASSFTWFPVPIADLIRQAADRPALRAYVDLSELEAVTIAGDRDALSRAFTDVMVNGRRLVAPRTKLGVRVATVGDEVVITFHHPGDCIPESMRSWLFEADGPVRLREHQVPVATFGLAYAREVARGHGGDIRLVSMEEGGMNLEISLSRTPPVGRR